MPPPAGASFSYHPSRQQPALLRDLSVSISLGERVGILGPNGAGKSTLLQLLTQQLRPTGGDAWLNRGAHWALF